MNNNKSFRNGVYHFKNEHSLQSKKVIDGHVTLNDGTKEKVESFIERNQYIEWEFSHPIDNNGKLIPIQYAIDAYNKVVRVTFYSGTGDPDVDLYEIDGRPSVILRSKKAVFDTHADAQAFLIERNEWEQARNH